MFSFKDKLSSIKERVTESVDILQDKIETINVSHAITSIKDTGKSATNSVSSAIKVGNEKTREYCSAISEKTTHIDMEKFSDVNFYKENAKLMYAKGSEAIVNGFKNTFEIDKDTSEIIDSIKNKLPARATDVADIFEQCKREALQRTIAAFCLRPIVYGLDNKLEARYDNLSDTCDEFDKKHNIRRHGNYTKMKKTREDARKNKMCLDDGYNSANALDPDKADIDHTVSAKSQFDNFLLRVATTNDELKDKINRTENIIFADLSLNRSKRERDAMEYLAQRGVQDKSDPDLVHIEIKGKIYTVNKKDVAERYNHAKKETSKDTTEAIVTIGATVVESGVKIATQQVVGLIVYETVDIFIEEIKDITCNFDFSELRNFDANITSRASSIQQKLKMRFEERDTFNRAKSLGIESGVAGVLSIIQQILIAWLTKTPAFVLAIIRESTLSAVRCVRILTDRSVDRYEGIKVVMAGTAMAVIGASASRLVSSAIATVPLLNKFNNPVTSVLTGIFVTGIPMTAIYIFDQQKNKMVFSLRK